MAVGLVLVESCRVINRRTDHLISERIGSRRRWRIVGCRHSRKHVPHCPKSRWVRGYPPISDRALQVPKIGKRSLHCQDASSSRERIHCRCSDRLSSREVSGGQVCKTRLNCVGCQVDLILAVRERHSVRLHKTRDDDIRQCRISVIPSAERLNKGQPLIRVGCLPRNRHREAGAIL